MSMRLHRPSALLLGAALVLGAVATPSLAFADGTSSPTTPTLTTTQLAQDLQAAETATTAAGKDGWSEHIKDTQGRFTGSLQLTYAVLEGRDYLNMSGDAKEIDVQGKGSYLTPGLVDPFFGDAAYLQQLLAAVGRPNARWIYMADPQTDLTDPETGIVSASPAAAIGSLLDSGVTYIVDTPAPASSTLANGDTTYTFSGITTGDEGDLVPVSFTVTLDSEHVLVGLSENYGNGAEVTTATFDYGPQTVTLPKAGQIVSMSRVLEGVPLLAMKSDARKIAATTRKQVATTKHTRSQTRHLIRTDAAKLVKKVNKADGAHIFSLRYTAAGVMLTGRNRFTHHTVVYTVKAAGKQAIVHHL